MNRIPFSRMIRRRKMMFIPKYIGEKVAELCDSYERCLQLFDRRTSRFDSRKNSKKRMKGFFGATETRMKRIRRIKFAPTPSNPQELEASKLEFDEGKVQYEFVDNTRKERKAFMEEQRHKLLSQGGEDPRRLDEDLQRLEMEDEQEEMDEEDGAELLIDQLKHCENDEKEVMRAN
jgi:hypothetical protein